MPNPAASSTEGNSPRSGKLAAPTACASKQVQPLSFKRQKLARYIIKFHEAHGYAPLMKQACHYMGYKSNGCIHREIATCVAAGYLTWDNRQFRTLRPVNFISAPCTDEAESLPAGANQETHDQ